MKKIIAREFLWLMVILVLAAPCALVFLNALELVSEGRAFSINEKDFIIELFILAYILNVIGLYILRLIVLAIQVLAAKETPPKK
jgi:hypothetical protein